MIASRRSNGVGARGDKSDGGAIVLQKSVKEGMGSSSSSSCVNGVDFMERGGRRVSFGNTGSRRDKKEVITEFVYTESRKGRKKCLESVKEVCLCGDWNRWAPIAMQCEQGKNFFVLYFIRLGLSFKNVILTDFKTVFVAAL